MGLPGGDRWSGQAEELASFDEPNQAIDFAEATVREELAIGLPV
jgi:hypothetical protein